MAKEHDDLLWEMLKLDLGKSKALQYIHDMKDIGINISSDTEWCLNNRQVVYQSIVLWSTGMIDSIKILKQKLGEK